ncbi:hypothetical protein CRENBAI_025846 [Crenichthys baileyi]|uniref:Uncharacterized protein n=1 Tax=Crenichthys baileyi TaxID=28760 RepID=A0AAV9QRP6_9TELE
MADMDFMDLITVFYLWRAEKRRRRPWVHEILQGREQFGDSKICCPALGDESASGTPTTGDRSEAEGTLNRGISSSETLAKRLLRPASQTADMRRELALEPTAVEDYYRVCVFLLLWELVPFDRTPNERLLPAVSDEGQRSAAVDQLRSGNLSTDALPSVATSIPSSHSNQEALIKGSETAQS